MMTGHFGEVSDIDWSSHGDYLSSCSLDQTSRIFSHNHQTNSWHEVSRCQIHGYDINSITNLSITPTNHPYILADLLVSGADEKVVRVFEPPAAVLNLINTLAQTPATSPHTLHLYFPDVQQEQQYLITNNTNTNALQYRMESEGGQQVLGLLTKSVKVAKPKYTTYYDEDDDLDIILQRQQQKQETDYLQPPTDDFLVKHTLWPELNKLYAHGFEIKNVKAFPSGQLLLTSCKGQTIEDSQIFIWETNAFKVIQTIPSHHFTITQIEVSPLESHFCSVSRDRTLCLYSQQDGCWQLSDQVQHHSKVIWGCAFSGCGGYVATASRDKRLKIYSIINNKLNLFTQQVFKESLTAVAFSPLLDKQESILAIGQESGAIQCLLFQPSHSHPVQLLAPIHPYLAPAQQVNRIRFRRTTVHTSVLHMAVCSKDHSVRIYSLSFKS